MVRNSTSSTHNELIVEGAYEEFPPIYHLQVVDPLNTRSIRLHRALIHTGPVTMPKGPHALTFRPPQDPINRIQTLVQVLHWRTEGEAHELMARRIEKVTSVLRIDVEEDTRNDDGLFFEKLFKECLFDNVGINYCRHNPCTCYSPNRYSTEKAAGQG